MEERSDLKMFFQTSCPPLYSDSTQRGMKAVKRRHKKQEKDIWTGGRMDRLVPYSTYIHSIHRYKVKDR